MIGRRTLLTSTAAALAIPVVTVAYVDEAQLRDVAGAFVAQALTQGIAISVAGEPMGWLAA